VKLAKELSRRATGQTLYILDEPTTGLHFEDVAKLLEVLHTLVDQGNTVLVIEHNLDIIKTADWVIDLGPEGGDKGGRIVAAGTPEDVAEVAESYTGMYLKQVLAKGSRAPRKVINHPNGRKPQRPLSPKAMKAAMKADKEKKKTEAKEAAKEARKKAVKKKTVVKKPAAKKKVATKVSRPRKKVA